MDAPAHDASVPAFDACLPQTQCRRCGYADCQAYAEALAAGEAGIDRCPPGGEATRAALLALVRANGSAVGMAALPSELPPLAPDVDAWTPHRVAWIDEALCIGCTQCLPECPTDAIIGAAKRMHTVMAEVCTGCELCLIACPVVDCIRMVEAETFANRSHATLTARRAQSDWLRDRYAAHRLRWRERQAVGVQDETVSATAAADDGEARQDVLARVLARARARIADAKARHGP